MSLTARVIPVYVLGSIAPKVTMRNLPVYVLASTFLPLVKGSSATDQLKAKIIALASEDISAAEFTFANPVASSEHEEQNTAVTVTANGEFVEGDATFYYVRRKLEDLVLGHSAMVLNKAGITTTQQLLPQLASITGLVLEARDILDAPLSIVDNKVTLTAGNNSYFFKPGTQVSISIS